MEDFHLKDPAVETQWRSLILFGKNSATYKFAFAKALLDLVDKETTVVTLEQLSKPYADYILDHLKRYDKQGNANFSEFLNACRSKLQGDMSEDELLEVTRKKGFVNVIDAFQNLSGCAIRKKFYEKKEEGVRVLRQGFGIFLNPSIFKDAPRSTPEHDGQWVSYPPL